VEAVWPFGRRFPRAVSVEAEGERLPWVTFGHDLLNRRDEITYVVVVNHFG